jgi:hypothetical protein
MAVPLSSPQLIDISKSSNNQSLEAAFFFECDDLGVKDKGLLLGEAFLWSGPLLALRESWETGGSSTWD